jgi:hypothetical protein
MAGWWMAQLPAYPADVAAVAGDDRCRRAPGSSTRWRATRVVDAGKLICPGCGCPQPQRLVHLRQPHSAKHHPAGHHHEIVGNRASRPAPPNSSPSAPDSARGTQGRRTGRAASTLVPSRRWASPNGPYVGHTDLGGRCRAPARRLSRPSRCASTWRRRWRLGALGCLPVWVRTGPGDDARSWWTWSLLRPTAVTTSHIRNCDAPPGGGG